MRIKKVLKIYFYAICLLTTFSIANYSPNFNNYYTSILTSIDEFGKTYNIDAHAFMADFEPLLNVKSLQWKDNSKKYIFPDENTADLHFEFISDPSRAFAGAGEQNAYVTTIRIKTFETPLRLHSLGLSPRGASVGDIQYLTLVFDDQTVPYSEVKDGSFLFKQLNLAIPSNSVKEIHLHADLSPLLNIGDRIRFDIMSPNDIGIIANGKAGVFSAFYPLESPYLSIVRIKSPAKE